jgi:LysR family hydrogen peroxide-inducible transcriptional activator
VLVHKHDEDSVWPPKSDSPPIIVIEADLTLNEEVAKLTRRYPSLKLISRRTSSFEMLRQMIATGEGMSLVPALVAESMNHSDGLTKRMETDIGCGRTVFFCRRRTDARAATLARMVTMIRSTSLPSIVRQAACAHRRVATSSQARSQPARSSGR